MDLHITIDRSKSISKEDLEHILRVFLPALLSRFKIQDRKTRVSVSLFSSIKKTELFNDFTQKESCKINKLNKMLREIPAERYFGTNLQASLTMVRNDVFIPKSGDRPDRQNVLLVFGDGKNWPYKYLPDYVSPLKVG